MKPKFTFKEFQSQYPNISQDVYTDFVHIFPGITLGDSAFIAAFISGYECAKQRWMKKYDEVRSEITLLRENSMMKEPK